MSGPRSTPPSNLNHLQSLVSKIASEHGREVKRVQRAVANTIVGQMLPPGVVKGGTAMLIGEDVATGPPRGSALLPRAAEDGRDRSQEDSERW